jgi:hypothetical protein
MSSEVNFFEPTYPGLHPRTPGAQQEILLFDPYSLTIPAHLPGRLKGKCNHVYRRKVPYRCRMP